MLRVVILLRGTLLLYHIRKLMTHKQVVLASPARPHFPLLGVAGHIAYVLGTHSPSEAFRSITEYHGRPSPCVLRSPQPMATHYFLG